MAISAEELNIILSAKDREFNKKINAANKRVRKLYITFPNHYSSIY